MMKDFMISFSLDDSKYFTAVRLAVGGVCAAADLDIDATEDFKVSVTESCLILKNCGFGGAQIILHTSDEVVAEVCGEDAGQLCEGENEFSLALISALVSSCEIEKSGDAIKKVVLKV